MTNINCFELFAGCGGLGYGFHKEGINIIACNELDSKIASTYKENYPDTNVIVGDITKQEIKDQSYDNFKDKQCDIILGGPPCVAYSMSGHRNSRDPRGQLFKDYVEMVKKLKPKVFVMENVKGILTMLHDKPKLTKKERKIADKYYELESQKLDILAKKKVLSSKDEQINEDNYINEVKENNDALKLVNTEIKKMVKDIQLFRMHVTDIIKNTFIDLGYKVEMKLLNAANYGVPQKRERVIFIGLRNDINKEIVYPTETHNKNGTDGKKKWVSVREAIDDLKDKKEDYENLQQIYTSHNDAFIKKIKNTPIGKSVNPKYTEAFFRCNPDEPSNTVKENHGGVFVHYEKNRVMTPRELARLQSFPDDFKFKGTKSNILVQLGNAVPCGLSHAIAKEIKKLFN
jgi:DNA (cytosine-5)-methyltransferase 1